MSMKLMIQAMNLKVGNPLRKLVLIKLADNANDKGECWPSYQYIADKCECGKSTVRNKIDELISMGFLSKENRPGNKKGKGNASNIYYLHLDTLPVPADTSPVPADGIFPVPAAGTRICHSSEPVNESAIKDNGVSLETKPERAIQFPAGFRPLEKHQALADRLGVNLQSEFEAFSDYHRSKGSTFRDWGLALNSWLRNAVKFSGRRSCSTKRDIRKVSAPDNTIPPGFRGQVCKV